MRSFLIDKRMGTLSKMTFDWPGRRHAAAAILACVLAGLPVNAAAGEVEGNRPPLIYFSESEPAENPVLRAQILEDLRLGADREIPLAFGQNRVGGFTFLIVQGRRETANRFDHVSQLFTFLVNNGWHSKRLSYSFVRLTEGLFYRAQPLELTCGKFSTYFSALAENVMGVHPKHIRSVANYNSSWRSGHVFREVYFPELYKWVMFDVDAGLLPFLDGTPLSTLELSLVEEGRYEKAVSAGLDVYGRGTMELHAGGRKFRQGPEAKRHADNLWKERRRFISVGKRHRFTECTPEEEAAWRKRAGNRRRITVSCDLEEYRARHYPVPRRDGVPSDISMSSRAPWTVPAAGLYGREFFPGRNLHARWTQGTARIPTILLGEPRDATLLLTVRGAPAAVANRAVTVAVNGRPIAEVASPDWEEDFRTIELKVAESALKPGVNVVELTAPAWRPSEVLGTVDHRVLGVLLASITWRPDGEVAKQP